MRVLVRVLVRWPHVRCCGRNLTQIDVHGVSVRFGGVWLASRAQVTVRRENGVAAGNAAGHHAVTRKRMNVSRVFSPDCFFLRFSRSSFVARSTRVASIGTNFFAGLL